MAKKATITPVTDTVNNAAAINTQLNAINDQLDNTLSLDGSVPNAMGADLDLNNNDLLNVGTINGASASGLSAGLTTVVGLSTEIATVAGISADVTQVAADTVAINAASANASAAAASAGAASTSETNAAASEAAAAASYDAFDDRYLGAKAVEPTLDNDGAALLTGALYFNTVANEMRVYNGAAWVAAYVSLSGALLANNNLSDLANATTSRTNLGVAIGTDVQAYDANLNSFVGAFTLPTVDGTAGQLLNTDGAGTIAFTDPVSPFAPVAVSGATQALDVGTYNFFDAGTLTADTTVSFSNVPTEARWTYTVISDVTSAPWDTTDLSYVKSFSVAAQETLPTDIFFKPDGTKLYVIGRTPVDAVHEYSLSTAWDISTASFVGSFNVNAQTSNPTGLFFKPDGLAMYTCGISSNAVHEYSLSTAWDISTTSFVRTFNVSGQEGDPSGVFFKPDGTVMYTAGDAGAGVDEWSLSTAWDISTTSWVRFFSVLTQESNPQGVFFKPDGLKMYVVGDTGSGLNEYSLSTAWNISTASFVGNTSVAAQEASPSGVFFRPEGTKVYIIGSSMDSVHEFAVGALNSITLPASVQNSPTETLTSEAQVSYTFFTLDGGTTVKLVNEEVL